jgi:hypothetical protein
VISLLYLSTHAGSDDAVAYSSNDEGITSPYGTDHRCTSNAIRGRDRVSSLPVHIVPTKGPSIDPNE